MAKPALLVVAPPAVKNGDDTQRVRQNDHPDQSEFMTPERRLTKEEFLRRLKASKANKATPPLNSRGSSALPL